MKLLCSAACTLVLGSGGDVTARHDPGLPAADPVSMARMPASERRAPGRARGPVASASGRARTSQRGPGVMGQLERLRDEGAITPEAHEQHRATFKDARRFMRRLDAGRRKIEMRGVIRILQGISRRNELTASRLPALFGGLAANRRWWSEGPLLSGGQRVSLAGSELVYQYFPGQGIQFHPLANFGKLNALWRSRDDERMQQLYEELLPLAAERAGGRAWEYAFWFGGGQPPWVSGLAQGTGLQSISRTGQRLERRLDQPGRLAEALGAARDGLGVFRTEAPEGVRKPIGSGVHYLLYSHSPRLYVINGFLQALVGLYDYGRISGDPDAQTLFAEGERRAREALPTFDTGAWSLYSRGSSSGESSLSYHTLTRDFLDSLCDRLSDEVYCGAEERFTQYLSTPPEIVPVTTRARGGTKRRLRFDLSKISRVSVRVTRGSRTVFYRSGMTLSYGTPAIAWEVPRRAGAYAWSVTATDLAGNTATETAALRVLRAKKRRR